jgi:uncharacterized protein YkwD
MISKTKAFLGRLLICVGLLIVIAGPMVPAATPGFFDPAFPAFGNDDKLEDEIFELINSERRKRNLSEFEWDDRLAKIARKYSRKMARGGFFSHYDREGNSVVERASDEKVTGWGKIGENLFFCEGIDDVATVAVKGWLRSPDHKRNMLDRTFSHTGIGVAESRDGGYYVTQVFLRP